MAWCREALPEPMLTQFYVHYMVSSGHDESNFDTSEHTMTPQLLKMLMKCFQWCKGLKSVVPNVLKCIHLMLIFRL